MSISFFFIYIGAALLDTLGYLASTGPLWNPPVTHIKNHLVLVIIFQFDSTSSNSDAVIFFFNLYFFEICMRSLLATLNL